MFDVNISRDHRLCAKSTNKTKMNLQVFESTLMIMSCNKLQNIQDQYGTYHRDLSSDSLINLETLLRAKFEIWSCAWPFELLLYDLQW